MSSSVLTHKYLPREDKSVSGFLSLLPLHELERDCITSGNSLFRCEDNIIYLAKFLERVQVVRIQQLL